MISKYKYQGQKGDFVDEYFGTINEDDWVDITFVKYLWLKLENRVGRKVSNPFYDPTTRKREILWIIPVLGFMYLFWCVITNNRKNWIGQEETFNLYWLGVGLFSQVAGLLFIIFCIIYVLVN